MRADLERISVLLASRRHATLHTLLARLEHEPRMQLLGTPVGESSQLHDRLGVDAPDVLVADDSLLRLDPASLRRIRERRPRLRVLLWCDAPTDDLLAQILEHGLDGFLLVHDSPDTVVKAVCAVCDGELWVPRAMLAEALRKSVPARSHDEPSFAAAMPALADVCGLLTRREAEVVEHVRRGRTNKEIGRELGIMEDTVKKHLQSVFAKLGVHRRGLVMLQHAPASLDDLTRGTPQDRDPSSFGEWKKPPATDIVPASS